MIALGHPIKSGRQKNGRLSSNRRRLHRFVLLGSAFIPALRRTTAQKSRTAAAEHGFIPICPKSPPRVSPPRKWSDYFGSDIIPPHLCLRARITADESLTWIRCSKYYWAGGGLELTPEGVRWPISGLQAITCGHKSGLKLLGKGAAGPRCIPRRRPRGEVRAASPDTPRERRSPFGAMCGHEQRAERDPGSASCPRSARHHPAAAAPPQAQRRAPPRPRSPHRNHQIPIDP